LIIHSAIKEWSSARICAQNQQNYCLDPLVWKRPPEGTMKLNIDGSRNGQNGKIAAGGVLRNSQGHWINGFQANLGIGEVLDAETWALFLGLKLAVECNITNLLVESDSAILVNSLLYSNNDLHPLGSLLACCKKLLQKFISVSVVHIYRECNMVADALAKNGINHEHGVIFLDNPPCYACHAYSDDLEDITHTRRIPVSHPG
jgi:ribonuclease HI